MKTYFYLHDFSPFDYERPLALAKNSLHDKTISLVTAEEIVRDSS